MKFSESRATIFGALTGGIFAATPPASGAEPHAEAPGSKADLHDKADSHASPPPKEGADRGGAHASDTTVIAAIVQLLQTIFLSASFYYAFVLAQTRRDAKRFARLRFTLVVILAATYAISMRNVYNPAVLTLALVAIFFAVEHYASLSAAERSLDDVAEKTMKASKDVSLLLNLEDGDQWRFDIYTSLGKGESWTGKMRYWDLDSTFFRRAQEKLKECDREYEAYWRACKSAFNDYIQGSERTLYRYLHEAASKDQAPKGHVGIRLIYEPPPTSIFDTPSEQSTQALRDIMGLMFHQLVFDMINRDVKLAHATALSMPPHDLLPRTGFAKIRIGPHAPWIHVTGDTVYEVFERPRGRYGQTLVRTIASPPDQSVPRRDDASRQRPRAPLAKYHDAALRRSMAIAGRGQSYLASLLLELLGGERPEEDVPSGFVKVWLDMLTERCAVGLSEVALVEYDDPIKEDGTRTRNIVDFKPEEFARLFVMLAVGILETSRNPSKALPQLLGKELTPDEVRQMGPQALVSEPLLIQVLS